MKPEELLDKIKALNDEQQFEALDRYITEAKYTLSVLEPVYKTVIGRLCAEGPYDIDDTRYAMAMTRTTRNVQNEQLFLAHRELYDELASQGVLVLPDGKAGLLEGKADECVTVKTSNVCQVKTRKE